MKKKSKRSWIMWSIIEGGDISCCLYHSKIGAWETAGIWKRQNVDANMVGTIEVKKVKVTEV